MVRGRRETLLAAVGWLAACRAANRGVAGRLVLKHQPLWGDPEPFRQLLRDFSASHPECELITEALPNSSDLAHQYFLTALAGGAGDFDVFVVDVVWVAELARAGWLVDLSDRLPAATVERDFLGGAAQSVVVEGRTWAVPWYVDAGLLYRRSDWFAEPPRTYEDLVDKVRRAQADFGAKAGYVWQGRQYEGLVCNAFEAIWGHGGTALSAGRLGLDSEAARAALRYLRALVADGVSARSVTSMAEEESRRVFESGQAAFMRNWPYALREAARADSPVHGRVGVSALPSASGEPGPGALGGYQLALNANAPRGNRDLAFALVDHLSSNEAQVQLAISYGRNPARKAAYQDPRLLAASPELGLLIPILEAARPRPVTPYYPMLADVLQSEFSAAVTGVRSPEVALDRAQALADHLMRGKR